MLVVIDLLFQDQIESHIMKELLILSYFFYSKQYLFTNT